MRIPVAALLVLLGGTVAAGCMSQEYRNAVERGDAPWYVATITSPDLGIRQKEMNIYELYRQGDAPVAQKNGLTGQTGWGEGHTRIEHGKSGTIMIRADIKRDQADLDTCAFLVRAVYFDSKEKFMYSFEGTKVDPCEKNEFEDPYLSGLIQNGNREWRTLYFSFRPWKGE